MRSVRYSQTFNDQLVELIDIGEQRFGAALAGQKRDALYRTVETFLARHPRAKRPNRKLGLTSYLVRGTPFVVLYDFDDTELRVHFVFLKGADLATLDPALVEW